jgi:hypothetical protein
MTASVLQTNYLLNSPDPLRSSGNIPNQFSLVAVNLTSGPTTRFIRHVSPQAYVIGRYASIAYTATTTMDLWASVAAGGFLEVRNIKGVPLMTEAFDSIADAFLQKIIEGETYVLTFYSSAAIVANATLFNLLGRTTLAVSSFFANGFENALSPMPTTITTSTDVFGQVTYSFTNHPLAAGQRLNLALASFALQSGTLNVTSSNLTVFPSYSDPFSFVSSVAVFVRSNLTTLFTGTITISISGVGVLSLVSLESLQVPPDIKTTTVFAERQMTYRNFSALPSLESIKVENQLRVTDEEQMSQEEPKDTNNNNFVQSANKRTRLHLAAD